MHVLCLLLVIVYAGEACRGSPVYQAPDHTLDRALRGSSQAGQAGPEGYTGHSGYDVNQLKKFLKTSLKNKELKHKIHTNAGGALPSGEVLRNPVASPAVRTAPRAPHERHTEQAHSVPVPLAALRPPDGPHRPLHSPLRHGVDKDEARGHPWPYLRPSPTFHFTGGPGVERPCNTRPGVSENIATAPPNVCDLCPSENGMNPLDPCTCVGVGGSSAGMISISCPASIVTLDQLSDIFHNTNFLTTHVYQFSLQGSSADGALTRDIWGDLDFKYVSINNNKITDVDNGAFIGSTETLISLDLANNEIKNYIAKYNDLPKLLQLNLRGNNISLVYSEDFQYPELQDLDLSRNQITSIGMHSFAALKKLRNLNLSYNLLTSIGDERFTFTDHDYTNVLEIDLSNNKIESLSENAFLGLRYVTIDFRHNQIHEVNEKIFSPIIADSGYYVFFYFTGNEMICDCDMMWVVEDGATTLCFDNFECTNNNETLYTLETSDLGMCGRCLYQGGRIPSAEAIRCQD